MQQPKMIVLGLISQGFRYGFEMEQFIDSSKMRMWARIGKSTIYKALTDLEKSGDVTSEFEPASRGPGKSVYSLTSAGEQKFQELVNAALCSHESVYSDRIAGLVLSQAMPNESAKALIDKTIDGLSNAISAIESEKQAMDDKPVAQVVIEFYRNVYVAEQNAMKEMQKILSQRSISKNQSKL